MKLESLVKIHLLFSKVQQVSFNENTPLNGMILLCFAKISKIEYNKISSYSLPQLYYT